VRDITREKKFEQQVVQSERLAAMGAMIGGVAHELITVDQHSGGERSSAGQSDHRFGAEASRHIAAAGAAGGGKLFII